MRRAGSLFVAILLSAPCGAAVVETPPSSQALEAGVSLDRTMPGEPALQPVIAMQGDTVEVRLRSADYGELAMYEPTGELINRCYKTSENCQMRFTAKQDGVYLVAVMARVGAPYTLTLKRIETAPVPIDPEIARRWGAYAYMAGRDWFTVTFEQAAGMDIPFKPMPQVYSRLSWLRYGEQLTTQVVGLPTTPPTEVLTWNPGTGQVEVKMANGSRVMTIAPDGSVTDTLDQIRSTLRRAPDGSVETTTEKLEEGRWTFFMRSVSVERTPANLARYANSTSP